MKSVETLSDKIERLENSIDELSSRDKGFAKSLCSQFHQKSSLSDRQIYWVQQLLAGIGGDSTETSYSKSKQSVEEIFDGTQIRTLLACGSEELKFPKLRYQTDGGSKIVFSYAKEGRWAGCTFISNGAKGENKVRYGFIASNGNGSLNRESSQEIKKCIRTIAQAPTEHARLQGQKYSNCCFCGLELTNKSSLHHGYGPICASKWNLPWGDTGDLADEEAAAAEEMRHIQLHDLGDSK